MLIVVDSFVHPYPQMRNHISACSEFEESENRAEEIRRGIVQIDVELKQNNKNEITRMKEWKNKDERTRMKEQEWKNKNEINNLKLEN